MKLKKLFFSGVLVLLMSPFAMADEIGTGYPEPVSATMMAGDEIGTGSPAAAGDEIGTGTPRANDEIGTGSAIAAWIAWWNYMVQSF